MNSDSLIFVDWLGLIVMTEHGACTLKTLNGLPGQGSLYVVSREDGNARIVHVGDLVNGIVELQSTNKALA